GRLIVIPGRPERPSPGSITTIVASCAPTVVMDSGLLAALGPGMTSAHVVAPAALAFARGGKQDAEGKADADAECHHRLWMPADLLAHHVVEIGGAFLHARDRVAGVFRRTAIGVGRGGLGLFVQAFSLLAGLFRGFVDRFAALLECLETRIGHKSLRK